MKAVLVFITIAICTSGNAQEIKDFTLVNVRNGKEVSLSNYNSMKAVVVVFTSQECPFDNYYKQRLRDLMQTYSGNIQFLLINSNTEAPESAEQMAIHYTDLSVPYLADKEQQAMTMLGAKKTPEVFLIVPAGGKFVLAYSGAIDDSPQEGMDVRQYFLKDAILKILSGEKMEGLNQRATGCTIRKK
jgi:peroxiredoxin